MNRGAVIAITSIGLAQALKIPIHYAKTKEWRPALFFATGGMPSSHSAGVSSLTTFVSLTKGVRSIDFALSLVYGLIVMYDAQGIRRQTGELTLKVNDLDELIDKINEDDPVEFEEKSPDPLKEMLGHQPKEVLGGALLGMIMGFSGYYLTKKR
ncbi:MULTISPECIES: divergent PAP2 family protein [Mesobacillus]|uniref:Acid phosphatase n=2 Tax=Mesobacillus TaxID=2675231 RepID=A0A0D6Z8X1_9BACI|nr:MULTISPECIES: divergent PAP2 family protein [Mesobacillus]KIY22234.1 acid phosphatase [Mesobacillus subterraneus]MDQ0412035.1 acid phosphatase family membrane protein YuiD [Mesobacillus stamsii]